MANTFLRKFSSNIGTTATTIGSYIVGGVGPATFTDSNYLGGGSTRWTNGSGGAGTQLHIETTSNNTLAATLRTAQLGDTFTGTFTISGLETVTLASTFAETSTNVFDATTVETSGGFDELYGSLTYTPPPQSNVGAVVIGLCVSNTTTEQLHVDVAVNNGMSPFHLAKRAPVPSESSIVVVGGDQKIVLQTGDSITVRSDLANSVDAIMTIMETESVGLTADPITYSITSNVSSVNEGNTVGFTVSTSNVPNGTVLYWTTVGNVSSGDFSDSVTSGNVTITNGSASITRTLTSDTTTEGVEYFDLALRTGSISGTIVATSGNVTVNDTSISLPPAASLLYTLDNPNAYGTAVDDNFGSAVSISNNYAIVAASGEDDAGNILSGKAYIYSTQTGALLYTLNNPNAYDTSQFDFFRAVAISGNLAIVGAFGEGDAGGTSSGKAYIYDISTFASNVISTATYTLNNPNAYSTSAGDYFGVAVAISGNLAIVGAYQEDDAGGTSSGKAYIYNISTFASNVISTATYTLNNPNAYSTSASDQFGGDVAISGNLAIVGAQVEDDAGGTDSGKAYIYDIGTFASNVISTATYTLNDPNAYGDSYGDYFGYRVAISGNLAIVGAYGEGDAGNVASGKAYVYDISTFASNVISTATYTLNDPNAYGTSGFDNFSSDVAISGNLAIVGAYLENDAGGTDSGKAYIYTIS